MFTNYVKFNVEKESLSSLTRLNINNVWRKLDFDDCYKSSDVVRRVIEVDGKLLELTADMDMDIDIEGELYSTESEIKYKHTDKFFETIEDYFSEIDRIKQKYAHIKDKSLVISYWSDEKTSTYFDLYGANLGDKSVSSLHVWDAKNMRFFNGLYRTGYDFRNDDLTIEELELSKIPERYKKVIPLCVDDEEIEAKHKAKEEEKVKLFLESYFKL